jgi:hypothetical protein
LNSFFVSKIVSPSSLKASHIFSIIQNAVSPITKGNPKWDDYLSSFSQEALSQETRGWGEKDGILI